MPGRFGPPDSDSDGLYDPDFSCTWYVFGSGDKLMQIYLTDLDIEESDNCQHDYIEVSLTPEFDPTYRGYRFGRI